MLISAVEETLARGKSPTGTDGPATIMNSLRTVSINGLTGPLKIAERSNNAYSRSFSFESFRAYDERMEYRGFIAANRADVRVCGGGESAQASRIGPSCAASAESVDSVVAYAQSDRTLHITWHWENERAHHRASSTNHGDANTANAITANTIEDAVEEEQLLSGYRIIIAAAGSVDVDVRVPRTQNNATFGLGDIRADVVYTVIVRALYDDGAIQADQVSCNSPASCSGSLPCLPSKTKVPTCDCSSNMLHTMGLERKPQLVGCRRCVPGLVCRGGGVSSTFTAPGWFAVNARKLTLITEDDAADGIAANTDDTPLTQTSASASTTGTTGSTVAEKSSMFRCPNKDACLGGWSVAQLKMNAQNASFHALYSQCADGYTGILCTACIEGYARGGDSVCSKCTVSRNDALLIILCSVFVIIMVVAIAIVAAKRAGRAPLLERAFLRVMTNATKRRGVEGAINLFFSSDAGEDDSTTRRGGEGEEGGEGGEGGEGEDGGGLSYDRFVTALRPGGSLALSVPSAIIDNEARSLWLKLDEDGDGAITSDELLAFFFKVKSGHKSANPVRVQVRMNE